MAINFLTNDAEFRKRVYEALSPEEKAEVDDFNERTKGMGILEIINECAKQPDGKHPMFKYLDRAKWGE